jgi:hypothetical protein
MVMNGRNSSPFVLDADLIVLKGHLYSIWSAGQAVCLMSFPNCEAFIRQRSRMKHPTARRIRIAARLPWL